MFKKNLIIGSVIPVLLLVLFALTGCSSPTDGAPGGIGLAQLSGTVSAEQLAESFAIHDVVQIDGNSTVAGLVPAGKTLKIAGSAEIGAVKPLIVNGRIEIKANALFDTTTGTLAKESAGTIYTGGELVLAAQYYDYPIIAAGTSFEPGAAILSLPGADAVTVNEFFAKPGVNTIKNNFITLSGAHVSALTNWSGTKKLILEHDTGLPLGSFDVSAESLGKLILGENVTVTIPSGGAVKAQSAAANVTIADGAKIILPAATADPAYYHLQGKIIVDGGALSAADSVTTAVIPADVDLSKGILTKEAGVNSSIITLPDASRNIGGISVSSGGLAIAGPATTAIVSVGTIWGTAVQTLTLPGVTVEVEVIQVPTGGPFTIAGPAAAPATILKPEWVSGNSAADILTFSGPNIALAGPIDLDAAIIILDLLNLGQTTDQLAQLARITGGGVQVPAITFNGTTAADSVFNTVIVGANAANITVSTSNTFNEGLFTQGTGKVINTGASGAITITLGGNSSFDGGLEIAGAGGATIAGGLTLPGPLTATGPVTFNGGVTLIDATNTIATAAMTVSGGTVTAGNLVFGEGVYTAAGTITINATSSAISSAAATDTLALGNNTAQDAKLLTLAIGTGGTGTFTAGANALVTLSGTGNGAIVVDPDGGAGTFTVGATAELKLGDGIIALGYAGVNAGSLVIDNGGGIVSGFTYTKGTTAATYTLQATNTAYQPSFTTNTIGGQGVLGRYYTDGVAITVGSGTYDDDPQATPPVPGAITGATSDTIYAAAGIHGGIINKNSDVAQ